VKKSAFFFKVFFVSLFYRGFGVLAVGQKSQRIF